MVPVLARRVVLRVFRFPFLHNILYFCSTYLPESDCSYFLACFGPFNLCIQSLLSFFLAIHFLRNLMFFKPVRLPFTCIFIPVIVPNTDYIVNHGCFSVVYHSFCWLLFFPKAMTQINQLHSTDSILDSLFVKSSYFLQTFLLALSTMSD